MSHTGCIRTDQRRAACARGAAAARTGSAEHGDRARGFPGPLEVGEEEDPHVQNGQVEESERQGREQHLRTGGGIAAGLSGAS